MKLSTFFLFTFLSLCFGETPKHCKTPGLLCETCSKLVACIQNDFGIWTNETVATCQSPKRCIKGECTTDFDPFCSGLADLKFPCRKVGIFPDPFYCNKFVLCIKNQYNDFTPYLNNCEKGFGFNIERGICDVTLKDGECEEGMYPLPLCQELGQSGSVPGSPAKYYICDQYKDFLYPVINVCPPGEIFDDFQCSSNFSTTTTVTSSTSSTTSTTSTASSIIVSQKK